MKSFRSYNRSDDLIPLALVQAFGDVSWTDILIDQDEINQIFDQYEARDGTIVPISTGQHLNFAIVVLYVQYRCSQVKAENHT